jgi:2-polyprenyl-3-methyl-5-hydroxy-6-metoxy-1,4-benzoquinol methylase
MTTTSPAAPPCNLCGSTVRVRLKDKKLAHLKRCPACGLVSVRNFPAVEALQQLYSEDYFKSPNSELSGYDDYERDRYCILKTADRRLDVIERHNLRRGSLLDVGCALGFFVEAAQRRGWAAEGIDISAHAVQYAVDKLRVKARAGVLDQMNFEPDSFDVISMWDVVEHFTNPLAQLELCHTLLRKDGLIALSTPDVQSAVAKVTGARWMGYKLAEEHLYYFSRDTLCALLDKAGFDVLETQQIGKDVALEFFARRLRMYAPPLATVASTVIDKLGLGRASIYVNPRDIVFVVARRRD